MSESSSSPAQGVPATAQQKAAWSHTFIEMTVSAPNFVDGFRIKNQPFYSIPFTFHRLYHPSLPVWKESLEHIPADVRSSTCQNDLLPLVAETWRVHDLLVNMASAWGFPVFTDTTRVTPNAGTGIDPWSARPPELQDETVGILKLFSLQNADGEFQSLRLDEARMTLGEFARYCADRKFIGANEGIAVCMTVEWTVLDTPGWAISLHLSEDRKRRARAKAKLQRAGATAQDGEISIAQPSSGAPDLRAQLLAADPSAACVLTGAPAALCGDAAHIVAKAAGPTAYAAAHAALKATYDAQLARCLDKDRISLLRQPIDSTSIKELCLGDVRIGTLSDRNTRKQGFGINHASNGMVLQRWYHGLYDSFVWLCSPAGEAWHVARGDLGPIETSLRGAKKRAPERGTALGDSYGTSILDDKYRTPSIHLATQSSFHALYVTDNAHALIVDLIDVVAQDDAPSPPRSDPRKLAKREEPRRSNMGGSADPSSSDAPADGEEGGGVDDVTAAADADASRDSAGSSRSSHPSSRSRVSFSLGRTTPSDSVSSHKSLGVVESLVESPDPTHKLNAQERVEEDLRLNRRERASTYLLWRAVCAGIPF